MGGKGGHRESEGIDIEVKQGLGQGVRLRSMGGRLGEACMQQSRKVKME